MKRVIVVGGGPAGIAAACRLSEAGVATVLIERTTRLGGRAASFAHTASGEEIDYGHHVLMRACTATQTLLRLIGAADAVRFQPRLRVPIRYPSGNSTIYSTPLPGPLHLLPALMHYAPLRRGERFAAIRAGVSLLTTRPRQGESFETWLRRHGQQERAIAALWAPITIATLNAHPDRVSARAARFVFTTGFFRPHGADIGLFTRPLSRTFAPAAQFIANHGGTVRYGHSVTRVLTENGIATGVRLNSGEELFADAVVVAVPPKRVLSLLPANARDDRSFAWTDMLAFSPIVNVHLWFAGEVMNAEFFIGVNSPVQAVFNVSRIYGRATPTHIVLSQSAAVAIMPLTTDEIVSHFLTALKDLVPGLHHTAPIATLVVRHPRATVVPTPKMEQVRPSQRTSIPGLYLAGDYTRTGWPATIEGAIRSGFLAADAILTDRR